MQITLARHGKPDLQLDSWVVPMAMPEWLRHYDQAGIVADAVPAATRAQAATAHVLASSTLRRCVQSAQQLAQGREFLREEVFCEAELPYPHWLYPSLPPLAWAALFRVAWLHGLSAHAEPLPQTRQRAQQAAQRLIQLARENDSVFLVSHGLINLLIARELLALGWHGPRRPVSDYWQCSAYRIAD